MQLGGWFILRESELKDAGVCGGRFSWYIAFPPVLLERKAAAIRKGIDLEKGNYKEVRTIYDGADRQYVFCKQSPQTTFVLMLMYLHYSWKNILQKALLRPFMLLTHEPIIQVMALYMSFVYGTLYRQWYRYRELINHLIAAHLVFLTTIPTIFQGVYQEPIGIAGLNYIAFGVGLSVMAQVNARIIDLLYRKLVARNGGVGKPEFRLRAWYNVLRRPQFEILTDPCSCNDSWHTLDAHRTFHHRVDCARRRPLDRTRYRYRSRWCGSDRELPDYPDVCHRRLHAPCCFRCALRTFPFRFAVC